MGEGTAAVLLGAGRTDPLGTRLGKGVMHKVYRVGLHTYLMKMGTGYCTNVEVWYFFSTRKRRREAPRRRPVSWVLSF